MGRFISINGEPVEQMKGQHYPRRMLENAELSWADSPPDGDKVTAGAWWTSSSASEIAVSDGVAKRLRLGVGSAVELETGGTTRALKVAAHLSRRWPAPWRACAVRSALGTNRR